LNALKGNITNFYMLVSHKVMPPAMAAIVEEGMQLDGFIAPGHVSTITGSAIYDFIPEQYDLAVTVSGFEPVDLLQSIYMLVRQIEKNDQKVEIQYKRVVKPEGNVKAQQFLDQVFELSDASWRGLGILKKSGYKLRDEYSAFDAEKNIDVKVEKSREPAGCICGEVLKGLKRPVDCQLFAKVCTPGNPVGACMVSSEGACQAYYKYRDYEE
jgi:hydrogenase expression/formation protein HypD